MQLYNFVPFYVPKPIAFVGPMGSGKSTIGKRISKRLSIPFFDSDQEVEASSGGYNVASIVEQWGVEAFKDAETSVIQRLLDTQPNHVLSTGYGAFIEPRTQKLLIENTITIYLKTNIEILLDRLKNRKTRCPIFNYETKEELLELLNRFTPIYEKADICIESDDETYQDTIDKILIALKEFVYPSV